MAAPSMTTLVLCKLFLQVLVLLLQPHQRLVLLASAGLHTGLLLLCLAQLVLGNAQVCHERADLGRPLGALRLLLFDALGLVALND